MTMGVIAVVRVSSTLPGDASACGHQQQHYRGDSGGGGRYGSGGTLQLVLRIVVRGSPSIRNMKFSRDGRRLLLNCGDKVLRMLLCPDVPAVAAASGGGDGGHVGA